MEIDSEKLISAVREMSPLWDMKDKRYHSRAIQRKLWAKVVEEIGGDVSEVKKKWRGQRVVFRREYKKVYKSGNEAPEEGSSSWTFSDQMMFLSDIVEPRQLKGNVTSPKKNPYKNNDGDTIADEDNLSDSETPNIVATNQGQINNSSDETTKIRSPIPIGSHQMCKKQHDTQPDNIDLRAVGPLTPRTGNHKRKKNNLPENMVADKLLEIERAKLQLFTEHTVNKQGVSDYQFLVSLFLYLKKVPEHRKLAIRNKRQQVFINEEEVYNRSSHIPSLYTTTPSPSSWTTETSVQIPSWTIETSNSTSGDINNPGLRQYFGKFSSTQ